MPTKTFFNLKEEKKERIEKALIHEFGKGSFEQASITNIINYAKIPRGSFYQYFQDKKDAVTYIIEKFISIEHNKTYKALIETKGDIFETALRVYDYRTKEAILKFDIVLAKNILEELRKNNINVFENKNILKNEKSLKEYINMEKLNLESKDDLYYFIRIITAITRSVTIEVFSNRLSVEEGRKMLEKELNIIKNGMEKI